MKRTTLFAIVLVLLLLAAGTAYAQATGYSLPWWTVDSGGGASAGGNYRLAGSIGQPDAGSLAGGNYRLDGGFWSGIRGGEHFFYLPMISK